VSRTTPGILRSGNEWAELEKLARYLSVLELQQRNRQTCVIWIRLVGELERAESRFTIFGGNGMNKKQPPPGHTGPLAGLMIPEIEGRLFATFLFPLVWVILLYTPVPFLNLEGVLPGFQGIHQ